MTAEWRLERFVSERPPDLDDLDRLARGDGFEFVGRTIREWRAGLHRFDAPGESFHVASVNGRVIGMCGVSHDPYASDSATGRLRHLYVAPRHRRAGIATALVETCRADAAATFARVRLRTSNPVADRFYRHLGFERTDEPDATHVLWLGEPWHDGDR